MMVSGENTGLDGGGVNIFFGVAGVGDLALGAATGSAALLFSTFTAGLAACGAGADFFTTGFAAGGAAFFAGAATFLAGAAALFAGALALDATAFFAGAASGFFDVDFFATGAGDFFAAFLAAMIVSN